MRTNNSSNTVYVKPEEADRIRNAIKHKLDRCQEVAGCPRTPTDPRSLSKQVVTAAFLADIAGDATSRRSSPDSMVAFAVGRPYPPCTVELHDLEPMKLSELCQETHHRGRMLKLYRAAPVVGLVASSWTVVEEQPGGDAERLEVFLHKTRFGEDVLESASMFIVKEPYFTLSDQGEPTIRIDHPSDLVACPDANEEDRSSSSGKVVSASTGADAQSDSSWYTTAKRCKDEGNVALKERTLSRAHNKYSGGLKLTFQNRVDRDSLASDLFRNRAQVNLLLGRYDEAMSDAVASLSHVEDPKYNDLDSKAYFRAGSAAYRLGQYHRAKGFFEEQQKLTPADKDAAIYLRRIALRLGEQNTGAYDFKRIRAGLKEARSRVDAASFFSNTKVSESQGRGRGLFATRDLDPGDVVLCEKASCVVWGHENDAWTAMTYDVRDELIRVAPAGLRKALVQQLLNNPSQVEKVMNLYGDYPGLGNQLIVRDGVPVIDSFQVHDIVARNAFGPGPAVSSDEEDISNASTGLWVMAAYMNHSCVPNVVKEYIGDLMVLRATCSIKAGEELTHAYDESSDYDQRQAALEKTWGFKCDCRLCLAEQEENASIRQKRQTLEKEANTFVQRESPTNAKRVAISRAQRLARAINETYDVKRYDGLPRRAAAGIQTWLAEATAQREK